MRRSTVSDLRQAREFVAVAPPSKTLELRRLGADWPESNPVYLCSITILSICARLLFLKHPDVCHSRLKLHFEKI